jgi:hypothetical protein
VPSVASSIVAGKTRRISVITGLVVSTEVPKSPESTFGYRCRTARRAAGRNQFAAHALDDVGWRAVAEMASTGSIGTRGR